MPQSNYARFADGVQISGVSLNVHQKGAVFYVCNSTVLAPLGIAGSDGNDGKTPDRPLATIAQAVTLCTANRGDKIILLPGHAESAAIAAGIALNKAGISVIADPTAVGSLRPTITLTAAAATITISAANVTLSGILIIGNFLNVAAAIDVSAKDAVISGVEFRDTDSTHNLVIAVRTSTGADNACDGLMVTNCRYLGVGTTAATTLVNCRSITGRLQVLANSVDIQGTTATNGPLVLATSKALTGAKILGNDVVCIATGTNGMIVGAAGSTGFVADNYFATATAAGTLLINTGTALAFHNNFVMRSAADVSGLLLPVASS